MAYAIESLGTVLTVGSSTFCYVSLQGLGVDGGDPLDATCLANTAWKTKLPQTLKEAQNITFTAKYEPADFAQTHAEINVNQSCTMNFASPLGTLTFWGYLKNFTPNEGGIGEAWEGTGEIVVTNMNGSNVETAPVYA